MNVQVNTTFEAGRLRLKAEQWRPLQQLAGHPATAAADPRAAAIGRLTSHGLVATDRRGCPYLTIFGFQRLRQGR